MTIIAALLVLCGSAFAQQSGPVAASSPGSSIATITGDANGNCSGTSCTVSVTSATAAQGLAVTYGLSAGSVTVPGGAVITSTVVVFSDSVGIGSTNPGAVLDVNGNSAFRGAMTVTSSVTVAAALQISDGSTAGIGIAARSGYMLQVSTRAAPGFALGLVPVIRLVEDAGNVGNLSTIAFGGESGNKFAPVVIGSSVTDAGGTGTSADFILATRSSNGDTAPTVRLRIDKDGIAVSSTAIPSFACNAGTPAPEATNSAQAGTFVAGAAAASCTVTFATSWRTTPHCVVTDDSSLVPIRVSTRSTSAITIAGTTISGDTISYFCWGAP